MEIKILSERLFEPIDGGYVSLLKVNIEGLVLESSLYHTEEDMLSYSQEKIIDCAAEFDKSYNRAIIMNRLYEELFGEQRSIN